METQGIYETKEHIINHMCMYIKNKLYYWMKNLITTLHTGHISVLKFISVLTRVEYYCLDVHDHRNQLLYIWS